MNIEKIMAECQDIEKLIRESGDNGYLLTASLFRLALNQPDDNICKTMAETYIGILKSLIEQEKKQ